MNGTVVEFKRPATKETTSHVHGPAVCLACGHEFVAVAPIGAPVNLQENSGALECVACHSHKAVLKQFTVYADVPSWTCEGCGGYLFSLFLSQENGPTISCACCGSLTLALDCFDAAVQP